MQGQLKAILPNRDNLAQVPKYAVLATGGIGRVDSTIELKLHADLGHRWRPRLVAIGKREGLSKKG